MHSVTDRPTDRRTDTDDRIVPISITLCSRVSLKRAEHKSIFISSSSAFVCPLEIYDDDDDDDEIEESIFCCSKCKTSALTARISHYVTYPRRYDIKKLPTNTNDYSYNN